MTYSTPREIQYVIGLLRLVLLLRELINDGLLHKDVALYAHWSLTHKDYSKALWEVKSSHILLGKAMSYLRHASCLRSLSSTVESDRFGNIQHCLKTAPFDGLVRNESTGALGLLSHWLKRIYLSLPQKASSNSSSWRVFSIISTTTLCSWYTNCHGA